MKIFSIKEQIRMIGIMFLFQKKNKVHTCGPIEQEDNGTLFSSMQMKIRYFFKSAKIALIMRMAISRPGIRLMAPKEFTDPAMSFILK